MATLGGQSVRSNPFTFYRTAKVSATYVPLKNVGEATSAWGQVVGVSRGSVWSEVLVGGTWRRSQTVTSDGSGKFVLPLTYGQNNRGVTTFRIAAWTPHGTAYTESFTVTRI